MYFADLHIHSRFSRATSRDCDLPHLDWWARRKGIGLLGTGDFTHPGWRAELKEQLVLAGEGVYELKEAYRLPCGVKGETPRFVVTGEISSIYKRGGKTRKVHNLILLPSLEAADALSARLEAVGNIRSDGRPILGMDSRDLMELTLDVCPDAEFIPAHIWTPHFSMFGAFSDFPSIEACFGDMTPYIHAVETGLSSDPPMNWRVSALDALTLVSHSDAHSPAKLGREADIRSVQCPGDTAALETALRLIFKCPEDLIKKTAALCCGMERPDFAALDAGMRGFGHLERWLAHAKAWMPRLSMRPEQAVKQWEAEYGASPALDKLCGAAVFYASFPALFETLLWGEEADFLRASGKGWESGAVRLMTLHAAKGMEFPAVFVSGVKAGVLPLERKGRAVDLCEERRLFYVGMTRAQEELILTFGEEPSAFLADLPDSVKRQCAPRRARPAQQLSLFS